MSENEKKSTKQTRNESDGGLKQLQDAFNEVQEQGFVGAVTDPTPNENYTVSGVTIGKPTPETDEKLREEARKARHA